MRARRLVSASASTSISSFTFGRLVVDGLLLVLTDVRAGLLADAAPYREAAEKRPPHHFFFFLGFLPWETVASAEAWTHECSWNSSSSRDAADILRFGAPSRGWDESIPTFPLVDAYVPCQRTLAPPKTLIPLPPGIF